MSVSYSRLEDGQIRLLTFLDDSGHRCSLTSHDLLNAPPYIALSYTWGQAAYQKGRSPTQKYQAEIDSSVISIQQNLYDALEHLGHNVLRRGCKMWIDFLCINQSDTSERSSQVSLMKEIYERATAVYSWLGLPFDDNEAGLAVALMRCFTERLLNLLAAHKKDIEQIDKTINKSTHGWPTVANADSWSAWEGIADMFDRAYWRRTWIYQEATTPGEICFFCGNHSFHYKHLMATILFGRRFTRVGGFPSKFAKAVDSPSCAAGLLKARLERGQGRERHLLELMLEFRSCLCTDARDKVFAALGHAEDVPAGSISADYTKELVDVYTDVVQFALEHENIGLSIFEATFHPARDSKDPKLSAVLSPAMPSWVPDWRNNARLGSLQRGKSMWEDKNALFDPCPGTSIEYSIDKGILTLSGFVLDDILNVTIIWDGPLSHEFLKIPQVWEKELQLSGYDIQNLPQEYRRALVADTRYTLASLTRGHILDWGSITAADDILDVKSLSLKQNTWSQLVMTSHGRRMGVITGGRLGIFPPATSPGDKVAMFMGGKLLYVIRPVARCEGYVLIGECYVNGLMDGEAMEPIVRTDRSPERIKLL
ncbi:heterokaryon incompatibility protein-domain-containing protein [Cadophora sp. MPI-SDFR-AT-0126]|nr:heterokaryon incompatibility protein-domain-containing protein [Leotiomycetes sp. MPI-SDFR-AT-0126]